MSTRKVRRKFVIVHSIPKVQVLFQLAQDMIYSVCNKDIRYKSSDFAATYMCKLNGVGISPVFTILPTTTFGILLFDKLGDTRREDEKM